MSFVTVVREDGAKLHAAISDFVCVSIPLDFDGPQPNAFGLPRASAVPFQAGDFIGDVASGGAVNCKTLTINPHGNGTHTECSDHVLSDQQSVHNALGLTFFHTIVTTVPTVRLAETTDSYRYGAPDDRVVSAQSLEAALADVEIGDGFVVRTSPNPESKIHALYENNDAPYFTEEAMDVIAHHGVRHLLVDFPSVDRQSDEGALHNHRVFWRIAQGAVAASVRSSATITELVYIPDHLRDGSYIGTIQIAPLLSDASPSRVFLASIS